MPGVAVSVNVELNKERFRKEENQKVNPKTIPIRTSTDETELATESAPTSGRPGFEAQQPNRGAQLSLAIRASTTKESQSRTDTTNLVSTAITRSEQVGLNPETVTVSVVVPSTYLEQIWRHRNPTPAGQSPRQPTEGDLTPIEEEERTKIQQTVFNKIPHAADTSPNELVSVTAFTPIPVPAEPQPAVAAQALSWLAESWSTLAMIGLAGVSLVMLRSALKVIPRTIEPHGSGLPAGPTMLAITPPPDESQESGGAKSRLLRRSTSGPSLRDDLVELVREDPDAAASILKGWIGNVG